MRHTTSSATRRTPLGLLALISTLAGSCEPALDEADVARRVATMERALAKVQRVSYQRQWRSYRDGVPLDTSPIPGGALLLYEQPSLASWRGRVSDPELARRVELFHHRALAASIDADPLVRRLCRDLSALERGRPRRLEDRELTDAELERIIRSDPSRWRRETAWKVRFAEPGASLAPGLTRLIRRRSTLARRLGYADYGALMLEAEELTPRLLEQLLAPVERAAVSAADRQRPSLLQLAGAATLRPWDLEVPTAELLVELESWLSADSLLARCRASIEDLGLGAAIAPVLIDDRSASGRSQRPLVFPIETPGDVRLLLNPAPGLHAHHAAMHELGHALHYQLSRPAELSLRLPSGGCHAETLAKIFERLVYQPNWLVRYAGAPPELAAAVKGYVARDELLRVRRFLAGLAFERSAYADPGQDLATLQGELCVRFRLGDCSGVEQHWASTPHLVSQPLANLHYLMARLAQAQVYETLAPSGESPPLEPATGAWLERELLAPGATLPWRELVRRATGLELGPNAYLERELGPCAAPASP